MEKNDALLSYLKEISGRRIEQARRRAQITQEQLAQASRMGVRWLREIESGNPASRLDDHLLCAHQLHLSTGHILLPILFFSHNMVFPYQLALGDLLEIERRCIDLIVNRCIRQVAEQLRTKCWPAAKISAA
jgi:transcriptional regulator with XRE-family HTH domain